MQQKKLTKTFMMILNLKNPLISMVFTKILSGLKGVGRMCGVLSFISNKNVKTNFCFI